ncbi:MAG: aminodeoxyfutalosine deaminase [Verrucomicrobiota bacterium]|jgi:cytosine/adenosine deaminase-related metal-dependent hydrolase
MIVRARVVVTMAGPPIENGAVTIEEGEIVDVGRFNPISDALAGDVVDLGDQALLPGLINAHCHLDYTCLRGRISPEESFTDWIRAINAAKAKLNPSDYVKSIATGFAEALKYGTTSMVNFEAFPELIVRTPSPIRTWWLAELLDVLEPSLPEPLVDLAMIATSAMKNRGLAPHAPFTASLDLYRHCQETARQYNLLLSTHLAESRDELHMFRDAAGPLFDFMKEIGRDMRDCGEETPLAHLLQQIALDERWLVAHLNELTESDFDLLGRSTTKFNVVHCPRSHRYFGHSPFQLERFRQLGFNICLGTDSLASNDNLSLFPEMREVRYDNPGLSPGEILEMVTVNPARALDRQLLLGQIKPGALADMIAIPVEGERDVFEQIIAFDKTVPWRMIDGHARNEG